MHSNVFWEISGGATIFRAPSSTRAGALDPVSKSLLIIQSSVRNEGRNADLQRPRLRFRAGAARTALIRARLWAARAIARKTVELNTKEAM
jgi:hypothetical protein